jgi:hypothetical protein
MFETNQKTDLTAQKILKVDPLEAHDRLKHLVSEQWNVISQGAEDCLRKNPDSLALQDKSPYIYLFAHPRTHEDGFTKRLLWQPRITKPRAQTNSYLFRANSKTDVVMVCWLIPPKELWEQYKEGNVCESNIVLWSINQFLYNREDLEKPDPQDMPDEKARAIWLEFLKKESKKNESFLLA